VSWIACLFKIKKGELFDGKIRRGKDLVYYYIKINLSSLYTEERNLEVLAYFYWNLLFALLLIFCEKHGKNLKFTRKIQANIC